MRKLIFKLFPTFYMWFLFKRHELLLKKDYGDITGECEDTSRFGI